MEVIRDRTGIALREAGGEVGAGSGTWLRLADHDPAAHPGRLQLRLETLEDASRIMQEVDGRAVQLGSDLISVSLTNDELEAQQGNVRRGRGGRGPAPVAAAPNGQTPGQRTA